MPASGLLGLIFPLAAALLLVLCIWQWRRAQGLARALARGQPVAEPRPAPGFGNLFVQVGDSVHESVLLYRDVILYANQQFARQVGLDRVDLVGRRLTDLVAADDAQLVADHLQRSLAGDPSAARFEVDLVGLQGQQCRLELTATPVKFEEGQALLLTGVEVIPTMSTSSIAAGTGMFEA